MPRRTRATALYRSRLFHGDAQGGGCTLGGGRGVRGRGRRGNTHGRAAGTFARQPKKMSRRHSLTRPQTPRTMEDPRLEGWGIRRGAGEPLSSGGGPCVGLAHAGVFHRERRGTRPGVIRPGPGRRGLAGRPGSGVRHWRGHRPTSAGPSGSPLSPVCRPGSPAGAAGRNPALQATRG
jgi:hypothetical protein